MSYDEKDYEKWLMSRGSESMGVQGYGTWLKTAPYNPGKSSFTTVLGMGDGLGGSKANSSMEQPTKSRKQPLVNTQSADRTQAFTEPQQNVDSQHVSNMDMAENKDVSQQILRKNSS